MYIRMCISFAFFFFEIGRKFTLETCGTHRFLSNVYFSYFIYVSDNTATFNRCFITLTHTQRDGSLYVLAATLLLHVIKCKCSS